MVKRDLCFIFALFFCMAVFAGMYYFLKSRRKEKAVRIIGAISAIAAVLVFLFLAVFSRSPHESKTELIPFWSYRTGVGKYFALDVLMQIVENICVFIPIGFLLPFLFGKRENAKNVLLLCFLLSLFAEVSQRVFSLGVCETDDLINNTLGAIVGYGLYRSMSAAEFQNGLFEVLDNRRFIRGLLPPFAVYEMMVLSFVLRQLFFLLSMSR